MSKSSKISRAEIAALMHISTARVDQLRREGIIPAGGDMRSTLEAVAIYFRDRCDLTAARREHLLKKSKLLDNALARENRSVVTVDEMDKGWAHIVLTIRQKLLSLPNKIAPRLAYLTGEVAIEQELRREVEEALLQLSRSPTYEPEAESGATQPDPS